MLREMVHCPACQGTGKVYECNIATGVIEFKACQRCGGTGILEVHHLKTNFEKVLDNDKDRLMEIIATRYCIDPEKHKIESKPLSDCKYCPFGILEKGTEDQWICNQDGLLRWLKEEVKE